MISMDSSPDIIKDASDVLKPIEDRGITVMQGWYDKDLNKCHVTLWDLGETDDNFSDDDAEGVTLSLQVTIFSKEDEVELAREIKSLMKENVELEINALAPQDRVILFGQLYEKGFLRKSSDDRAPEVAVGWRERKLNGKYEFKWLYVGKFAEGISEEASTKEGKLSPTTKSIKGSFYERSIDNLYEVSVDESNLVAEDTDAATAIKDWFSKVQEAPDAAA